LFTAVWVSVALAAASPVHAQTKPNEPVELASPDPGDDLAEPAQPAAPTTANRGADQVRLRLHAAQEERARASLLLPWLAVGVGATTLVVAASSGAIKAMACDTTCATPNWVALTVMIGAGVATLGTIWLLRRHADIRELDSHVYHLEQELERVRLSRSLREPASNQSNAFLSWRFVL
jgi:hypothetical protein